MKKAYLTTILALSFGVILFQACGSVESSTSIPSIHAAIPVQVTALQKQELSQEVQVSGRFTTKDETSLAFKTGGVVSKVLVNEGDFIRKGQLLATLDLTEIHSMVNQAALGFEKAKRDFERAENLYKDSVATLEQYQNARTAMSVAEQQLQAAKFNLGFSEIRAVKDGYVLKKYVNAGQVVSPGTPILQTNGAGKAGQWTFKAGLSDKEWSSVQEGDSAIILTDANQGRSMQARVSRKAEGVDPATGTFTVELLIEEDKSQQLASGLFGTATIFPSVTTKVWGIPHEALLDANGREGFVFVTFDNKKALKVPVTLSFMDNEKVYISSGLENTTSIITTGSAYLTDSSSIQIVK